MELMHGKMQLFVDGDLFKDVLKFDMCGAHSLAASHALFGLLPGAVGDLLSRIPFLSVGIPAVFSLYFDWFSSFMQAFIFCMLTMMYIAAAAEAD